MPGLFGWITIGRHAPRTSTQAAALLGQMADRMSHLGGEQLDTWTDLERGFAIARISLGQAERLPWPGRSVETLHREGTPVFLDGTLHGDAHHVAERLRDLARRGRSALAGLAGSFVAARWEPHARRVTLAVDRRASRPLVYAQAGDTLYFAPEVKALLSVPGLDKTLDEAALGIFLGSGYLLGSQTLFERVRRLPGGEALVVDARGPRLERYWRYRVGARGDGTPERDLEAELGELVRGAVERNLGDVDRTVVFLSGGVDSRAIAEAAQGAARRQGKQVRTLTWAFPGAGAGSDLEVAQRVADTLGTRHRSVARRVSDYGARLCEITYLLDGLTDVAAFHPHEHTVMRELAAAGTRAVLRGDECFGWLGHVESVEEALLSMNLRPMGPLKLLDKLVRHEAHERWSVASAAALDEAARPLRGEHPDDAKDLFYFAHRLQGYLGSAAYLKLVCLDHRAPLVDEAVLDFNARVPASLRADKLLFARAAGLGSPDLWRIPFATQDNLEDWGELLAAPSPVRRHVEAELADRTSGFWELVDPDALRRGLPPLGRAAARAPAAILTRGAKRVVRAALRFSPPLERRLVTRSHRAGIRYDQICLRMMVLKSFYDVFVAGDGSRRALEKRLSMARSEAA